MNRTDKIYFTGVADIERQAQEIKAREFRINRDTLGLCGATRHANRMSDAYRHQAIQQLEANFED